MTITQTGSSGTGRITLTNEASATLQDIVNAVSGATRTGQKSFHIDRRISLINSQLTIQDESLVHRATSLTTASGSEPFLIDQNSTLIILDSNVFWDWAGTGSFIQNDRDANNHGQIEWRRSVFNNDNSSGGGAPFWRLYRGTVNGRVIEDCQFVNGNRGRIGGSTSIYRRNRAYGGAQLLSQFLAIGEYADNFVDGASEGYEWNADISESNVVRGAVYRNLTSNSISVNPGNTSGADQLTMINMVSNQGRTITEAGGAGEPGEATVEWVYSLNATVTDADDDLPEQNVQLDVVATTSGGAATPQLLSNASGVFAETLVERSQTLRGGGTANSTTEFGPHRIRYWKYEFVPNDRTLNFEEAVNDVIRLPRDPTIVSTTAPSATRTVTTLDELRDSWKLETGADLDLTDLLAGGGVLDAGSLNLIFDGNLVGDTIQRSGSTVTIKAGSVDVGSVYSAIETTGTITFVDGASAEPAVVVADSTGRRVPVAVTAIDASTSLPISGARVLLTVASLEILQEVTDVNGEVLGTYTDTSFPVAVEGRVRRSTTSPFYRTADIVGSIAASGFSATVSMVLDE